jgi:hypothetical protein
MIAKNTLESDTKKYLEELLNKNPRDLIPDEIAFLKARKDYLTESEIKNIPKIEEVEVVKEEVKTEPKKVIKWTPKNLK